MTATSTIVGQNEVRDACVNDIGRDNRVCGIRPWHSGRVGSVTPYAGVYVHPSAVW